MAFYFALFNVSNVNFDRPHRRYHRSSSPRRTRRPLSDETTTSGALHDYRLLPRPRILGSQPVRPPTPPLPRTPTPTMQLLDVPERATRATIPSSLLAGRCIPGKKVTFEERSMQEVLVPAQHNVNSVPFLGVREASASNMNGNLNLILEKVNIGQRARARMDRHLFEKVALWAATGEVSTPRNRLINTYLDDIPSPTVNDTMHTPEKENETSEECCLVSSRCSVDEGRARAAVFNSIQNVENELIEHQLLLTAPTRRRLWKPSSLIRRRSTSDRSIRYGWSYLNPGFRFAEEENLPSGGQRMTMSFNEAQHRRPHFVLGGDTSVTVTPKRSLTPSRGAAPHTPPLTWKRALRRLNGNQQLRSLSTPNAKESSRMSLLF